MAVLCYVLLQSVGPPRLGGLTFTFIPNHHTTELAQKHMVALQFVLRNYEQEEIPRREDILTILPHILSTKGLKSPHVSEQGEW